MLNCIKLKREHLNKDLLSLLNQLSKFPTDIDDLDLNVLWKNFNNQTNISSIVALSNNNIVGYGSIIIETKIRGGKCGHIEDIVVDLNLRRLGIGKMIVEHLIQIANNEKCYKITLSCHDHNIKFYESLGFKNTQNCLTYYF